MQDSSDFRLPHSYSSRGETVGFAVLFLRVQRLQKLLLGFGVDRSHVSRIDTPLAVNLRQRDNRLGHRRVPSRRADAPKRVFHHTPCRAYIPDIPHRDNVVVSVHAADACPLYTFKLKAEIRDLWDKVI